MNWGAGHSQSISVLVRTMSDGELSGQRVKKVGSNI